VVFITKGTRDEAYHYAARGKEKRMYRVLDDVKKNLRLTPLLPERRERSVEVENAMHAAPCIVVDYRELDPYEKDHAMFIVKKK